MKDLEQQGISTVAIRNRARTRGRKARGDDSLYPGGLFSCCGLGLSLCEDDFGSVDYEARRKEFSKTQYEERKKSKLAREEELRTTYSKTLKAKQQQRAEANNQEQYEVVED